MQKTSIIYKKQIHLNMASKFELKFPSHDQETSDFPQNNFDFRNLFFHERNEPEYSPNFIENELSCLDSFLDIDCPETIKINDLNEYMPKTERPLFLTKKIKRNIDNDNNFFDKNEIKKRKIHLKTDFDNILTKVQVHFLNFVINLCNDALKLIIKSNKQYFRPINYEFKKNITYDNFNKLKYFPIKVILEQEISKKYKLVSKSSNSDILNSVIPLSQWLNDFFNINYMTVFNIYYNNCKPLKKINFKGKEIILSQKTKAFNALLKKNKLSRDVIIKAVETAYFNMNKNLTGKFFIIKPSENKKEN